jgi:nicotinamide riboside kinase
VIVVVEGPSAAGKSMWASRFDTRIVIHENGRIEPPPGLSPDQLADFWVHMNCQRWAAAVDVERSHGVAVCDTDALKLHYDYSLARVGMLPWEHFATSLRRCRAAIDGRQLGIADVVLVSLPDDSTLDRNRRSDGTRRRRHFDLHRRLTPAIRDWYAGLANIDPARVGWSLPAELPEPVARSRFDVDLFDEWMSLLPRDPL